MDRVFAGMHEADFKGGRPSIAPEKLLRAMLLQVLYSIRSEGQFMEQTQYDLPFRWVIGLSMDDSVWVPTVFSKNRERLIRHDAVVEFSNEVCIAQKKNWLLWVGEDRGAHARGDGARVEESRPGVRAEHGRLQPRAYAFTGTGPPVVAAIAVMRRKTGLKPSKNKLDSR